MFSPADRPRRRNNSKAGSPIPQAALIERGRITTVNVRDYTVDVRTEFSYKPRFDIPFMTPYCMRDQGEGINFMPEVGSVCWIATPSEEGRDAFVLGWTMPDEQGSYRSGRELLNPGDIYLSTRDKNFIAIRRGGIVQLGATKACQRIFLPIRNVMQDFAENYEMHTPAGDLQWSVLRKDEDSGGHQACVYTLACKEFADDEDNQGSKPLALLKIGSHGDGNSTILTLQTRNKGGGDIKTSLTIDKDGNVAWTMEKNFSHTLKNGDYLLDVQNGQATIKSKKAMALTSNDTFDIKAAKASTFKTDATMDIESTQGMTIKGAKIDISEALYEVLRNSPDLQAWMTAVNAALETPCVNGKPVLAGASALAPKLHFNKTVKV